jgi:SAM-dependent methyltransferase
VSGRFGSTAAFSRTAAEYEATMAPALLPVAERVVRVAALQPGETVLDVGTGTGTAAALALGEGRRVIGLDGAAGMLEIAAHEVPEAELIEADFTTIPLDDASVDVLLAVHALLFATDRVATLREWLRVTAPGGRMSLSVPGPGHVVPSAIFGGVHDRYDIEWSASDYPETADLADWARRAGCRTWRPTPIRRPASGSRTKQHSGRGSGSPASARTGHQSGSSSSRST